jgi:hypothetical protein
MHAHGPIELPNTQAQHADAQGDGGGMQGAGLRIDTQIQLLVSNKRVDLIVKICTSTEQNNINLVYSITGTMA